MKLFLIDAYALIYRSYYAFIKNPRINSKGVNTSAIFGFINSLEDVLKRENPTHIAVAFDPKGPTFRHEAFEQYKAQREETPEVIRQSVPIIKEIIEAYNIPILEVPRYEADDVIGTVSKQAEKEGFEVNYFFPDDYGVPKYYEGIFLASDDMIANNSDTLKGFLRACSKGFEDFKSNTDDVLQVLLDNQDEANFALDPDVEKKSCETLLPLMETEDAKFLSQTEQCWQENIDWMYDQGLIAEKPDVSDVMVNLDF